VPGLPEADLCGSRHHGGHAGFVMIAGFGLGGRDVSDRLEEAAVVEPVDPFEGGGLDRLEAARRSSAADHLGLEEADHTFGKGIVVGVADAADRRLDPDLGQALGVLDGNVLDAPVAVMDQPITLQWPPVMERLLQRIQHEACLQGAGHPPADDPAGMTKAT